MLRSLFTGISGLRAEQQMLDVTANNIANVNTAGFKSSSTVFQSTLSQTLEAAGRPGAGTGGSNPMQIGLGVQLGATQVNMEQGISQYTGRREDALIDGDGFFVVADGDQQLLTRAGSFSLDTSGHLVTPAGSVVQSADGGDLDLSALTTDQYSSWSIGADGVISAVNADTGESDQLGTIAVATVPNPAGLQSVGGSQFAVTVNSGAMSIGAPKQGGRGELVAGYVEGSNVDLSNELTNLIIAQRAFQANSRVVTTSDEILQSLVNLKN